MEAGLPIFPRCLAGFRGRVPQEGDREGVGREGGLALWAQGG